MSWEPVFRRGTLADGGRVFVVMKNEELGLADFIRPERIMRADNVPAPQVEHDRVRLVEITIDA